MRLHTRIGASVCLTVFSLLSITLLLPSSRVSTQLQKITLVSSIDKYASRLWNWGSDDDFEDRFRIVTFGDSWVDSLDEGAGGRGGTWVDVLCGEINCTSHLNFAASQPPSSYPASPPTGAITSNQVYISSLNSSAQPPESPVSNLLPDLATQIQEFIALPQSRSPRETIFVVSFGFWDIYHFAGLSYTLGQNATETTVNELFTQLNILYNHYARQAANLTASGLPANATGGINPSPAPFRLVIPKLFDPTLVPGWLSQRPVPLAPSSVSEQQKNAVHLTSHWNLLLENKMTTWIKEEESEVEGDDAQTAEGEQAEADEVADPSEDLDWEEPIAVEKEIFYYDLPQYLLDLLLEHQLEESGLTDAAGLGTGESPFESVSEPCVREAAPDDDDPLVDVNGLLVCREPAEYLFYDGFNLGPVANEAIGKEIGAMIREGKDLARVLGV